MQLPTNSKTLRRFARLGINIIRQLPVGKKQSFFGMNYFFKRIKKEHQVKTSFGFLIYSNTVDYIHRMIFNFGFWEPDLTHAISRLLKPNDVFVDVGANIGYFSLLASKIVGTNGHVVSVEPHPYIFNLLKRNIHHNNFHNVTLVNTAAGRTAGEIEFFAGQATSLGESTTVASRGFSFLGLVKVRPLISIIPKQDLCKTSLIKIDVEGAESDILYEIIENLHLFPDSLNIIVELGTDNADRITIFRDLLEHGFNAYMVLNEYDDIDYINWSRPALPKEIKELPHQQVDLIFSKKPLDMSIFV